MKSNGQVLESSLENGDRQISILKTDLTNLKREIKWLDEAREYVLKHKRLNQHNKLFFLSLLNYSNIGAWQEDIDDGTSPADSIEENISCAD